MKAVSGNVRAEGVRKLTRMLSGVTVVAVMTAPFPCPHGKCAYCPGGPEFGTPQSYYGDEPALMRAMRNDFDPYEQVRDRLNQYLLLGHVPSKVDVIVMGGTFTAMPWSYKLWFVTSVFEAFNRFPEPKPKILPSLEEAHARNETAKIRVVGLTFETRPDWARERHADEMLYLGGTRVEVGVQNIYDDILVKIGRGHTVRDTIEATRILKDSGFKIVYHIMPGLPGSDLDRDLEMIKELFSNPDFMPDMLESGTRNNVGIAGLGAGVDFILARGVPKIREHDRRLTAALLSALHDVGGVTVYGPLNAHEQTAVVSITFDSLLPPGARYDYGGCGAVNLGLMEEDIYPAEAGKILTSQYDILVRTGLHCAPVAHRTLKTFPEGTVRISMGCFNTLEEVEIAADAVRRIAAREYSQ